MGRSARSPGPDLRPRCGCIVPGRSVLASPGGPSGAGAGSSWFGGSPGMLAAGTCLRRQLAADPACISLGWGVSRPRPVTPGGGACCRVCLRPCIPAGARLRLPARGRPPRPPAASGAGGAAPRARGSLEKSFCLGGPHTIRPCGSRGRDVRGVPAAHGTRVRPLLRHRLPVWPRASPFVRR